MKQKKNGWRRRLSMSLIICMAAVCFWQSAIEAEAAKKKDYRSMTWDGIYLQDGSTVLQAEIGKNVKHFYVGDYIIVHYTNTAGQAYYEPLSVLAGASYVSSDPSVAKIDAQTGLVTPVAKGGTVITAAIGNLSLTCELKVISSVKLAQEYKIVQKRAKSFIDKIGIDPDITAGNRYAVVNLYNQYLDSKTNCELDLEDVGYMDVYDGVNTTGSYVGEQYVLRNKIVLPIVKKAEVLGKYVDKEIYRTCPIGENSEVMYTSTAVKGKGTTVTMTLNRKVTADDIFGIRAAVADIWDDQIKEGSWAQFPIHVKDLDDNRRYYAIATVTKGSAKLQIELERSKMKKGHRHKVDYAYVGTYALQGSWLKQGKTVFTAK